MTDSTQIPTMKLAIRTDPGAGFAVAYCASIDGEDRVEIGRISVIVLDGRDGPFFRRWVDFMRDAMTIAIKEVWGTDVASWSGLLDPADLEGEPQA